MIVEDLIPFDFADREVLRFRMREIQAADRTGRIHGAALGQRYAGLLLHIQQLPRNPLLCMIGAGGIAGGWPNSPVALPDQLFSRELFHAAVAPVLARSFVQVL